MQDSTIDFEKRRNVPVRYDRNLVQTTIKVMKRVGEIKARRERAFFKSRWAAYTLELVQVSLDSNVQSRMAVAKAKQRAHRQKALEKAKGSVNLHEPMVVEETLKVREKIKVPVKSRSVLVQGGGRSMGMEVD